MQMHLTQYKIATMEDLKRVLGTDARMTLFRKLKKLSYKASYTYNDRFYALQKTGEQHHYSALRRLQNISEQQKQQLV